MQGLGGNSGSSYGIYTDTGANIIGQSTATGDLTFIADSYYLSALNIQTAGTINLKPLTPGKTIGIKGGAGDISFTDASFFNFIDPTVTPSKFVFGDSNTGNVTANAQTWNSNLELVSGLGNIVFNGAQTLGNHTLLATTASTGDIVFEASGSITSTAINDAVVLASGRDFLNNAGEIALSTPSDRWLVYSTDPTSTSFEPKVQSERLIYLRN